MAGATLIRRAAATLLAIIGGGIALYAWVYVDIIVIDSIVTWPQRVLAVVAGAAFTAAVIAGARALLGLSVASWWLFLPPAIIAIALLSRVPLIQLLYSSA